MDEKVDQVEALLASPFFVTLSAEDLAGVLAVGRTRTFEPGQAIVTQGEPGDGMYVVLDGHAEVDVGGRFHRLGPGDLLGEMALVSQSRRMATVTATEPVEALMIPVDGFRAFLLEHPAVTLSMLQAVVARLREVEERIDAWVAS